MHKYQGRILSAFETVRETDGSGEEIHVLEFPSESLFTDYRADKSLEDLANLRNQAISNTEVEISLKTKSYT